VAKFSKVTAGVVCSVFHLVGTVTAWAVAHWVKLSSLLCFILLLSPFCSKTACSKEDNFGTPTKASCFMRTTDQQGVPESPQQGFQNTTNTFYLNATQPRTGLSSFEKSTRLSNEQIG